MSASEANTDYMNDKSKCCVRGFIRKSQSAGNAEHIPKAILTICLLYYAQTDLQFDKILHGNNILFQDAAQHKNAIVCGTGKWSTVYSKFIIHPQIYHKCIITWIIKLSQLDGCAEDKQYAIGLSSGYIPTFTDFDQYRFMYHNRNTFGWHFYRNAIYAVPREYSNGRIELKTNDSTRNIPRSFGRRNSNKKENIVKLELNVEKKELKLNVNDKGFSEIWHDIDVKRQYRLTLSIKTARLKAEIIDVQIKSKC